MTAFNSFSYAQNTDFWWGVGHAAFQVEGSPVDSDWKQWTDNPKNIADGSNANKATDFWNSYEKDFDLAQQLGSTMFRISIAWERIQPAPGQWDLAALEHYEKIILALRKRNIEPMVTLQHFALPGWLAQQGGLESADFAEHFTKYSLTVVRKLSLGPAKVRWWMTFNEPMVLVTGGYLIGEWPPGKSNVFAAYRAAKSLIKAHNDCITALRGDGTLPQDLKLSISYHWRDMHAENFGELNSFVANTADWLFNRWFLNAIHASTLDYLGINYYGKTLIHLSAKPPFFFIDEGEGEKTDLNWVIYPEGLGHVIENAYNHYNLPIIISENGLADAQDSKRIQFIKDHVAEIKKARAKNIPVIGYLHWSLTDNFEWAKGLTPRFGLVEMDYVTLERKPRPSFEFYKELIKAGL